MHPREIGNDPRQQIGRNGRDHADTQPALELIARGARKIAELVHRAQDVADTLDQFLPEPRKRDLARAALQQRAAERLLHLLDLHRQRRLRNRARTRRAAEMAMARQRIEIPQLPQGEIYHQIILLHPSLKSTSPDGDGGLRLLPIRSGSHPRRQSWMTEQNARSRALVDTRIANGGRTHSTFRCSIATPACLTRRTRPMTMPRSSSPSTSRP